MSAFPVLIGDVLPCDHSDHPTAFLQPSSAPQPLLSAPVWVPAGVCVGGGRDLPSFALHLEISTNPAGSLGAETLGYAEENVELSGADPGGVQGKVKAPGDMQWQQRDSGSPFCSRDIKGQETPFLEPQSNRKISLLSQVMAPVGQTAAMCPRQARFLP